MSKVWGVFVIAAGDCDVDKLGVVTVVVSGGVCFGVAVGMNSNDVGVGVGRSVGRSD